MQVNRFKVSTTINFTLSHTLNLDLQQESRALENREIRESDKVITTLNLI